MTSSVFSVSLLKRSCFCAMRNASIDLIARYSTIEELQALRSTMLMLSSSRVFDEAPPSVVLPQPSSFTGVPGGLSAPEFSVIGFAPLELVHRPLQLEQRDVIRHQAAAGIARMHDHARGAHAVAFAEREAAGEHVDHAGRDRARRSRPPW